MDAKAVVIELLTREGSATRAVCAAEHVVCGSLGAEWTPDEAGVVVTRTGGGPGNVDDDLAVIAVWCYGGGRDDLAADVVADAVMADLDKVVNEACEYGRLVSSECTSRVDDDDGDMAPSRSRVVLVFSVTVCD